MLKKLTNRKNRFVVNERKAFWILPLVLLPILFELFLNHINPMFFKTYKDEVLIANIIYIVVTRFAILDSAVYIFSRSTFHIHLALMQIVLLYLEITVITIIFYAILFDILDVFSLFHLSANLSSQNLQAIHEHSFITSVYISTVTFTTLGSGDWIPQTLPAMIAVVSEVILGVVQGGVFVAILIYAHQNKEIK